MSVAVETTVKSFVVLPLGKRRVAFAADSVIELTVPERLQNFPHRTGWISGVLVRRNRIVPVCDISELFGEEASSANRFYLIAEWQESGLRDWCAIPVAGECELASAETLQPRDGKTSARFSFVIGSIPVNGEEIEIVDLAKLIQARRAVSGNSAEESSR
ncbi:MAG TPA: chemotaxis protein CheW [Candidatus Acidoferrales bacterium]|nr:chemotaxis protein CheW [Candidatus Acidoferrales bacterium]